MSNKWYFKTFRIFDSPDKDVPDESVFDMIMNNHQGPIIVKAHNEIATHLENENKRLLKCESDLRKIHETYLAAVKKANMGFQYFGSELMLVKQNLEEDIHLENLEWMDDLMASRHIEEHGLPKGLYLDGHPGGEIHVCEEKVGEDGSMTSRILLTLKTTDNAYSRVILSELVKAYNKNSEKRKEINLKNIRFGDEIEPVAFYADDKKRKFIFMSWMGDILAGYARVGTVLIEGEGFDEQGIWFKNFGLVLQQDSFVHKSKIKVVGI